MQLLGQNRHYYNGHGWRSGVCSIMVLRRWHDLHKGCKLLLVKRNSGASVTGIMWSTSTAASTRGRTLALPFKHIMHSGASRIT